MKKNICEKCFRNINKGDDYFMVTSFVKGKKFKEGFMHKKCNEEINKQNEQLAKTINGLGSMLPSIFKQIGIEPPEKIYEVK